MKVSVFFNVTGSEEEKDYDYSLLLFMFRVYIKLEI